MRYKIILAFLVVGVIFWLSCQPVVVDTNGKGTLSATRTTTVKAEPDFNAGDVATVNQNENLILIYPRGDWYRVRLPNNMEGWIHKTLVKLNPYREGTLRQEIGIRWKPTESSAVSQIIPAGSQIRILQESNEWILVQPLKNNNMGWVSRSDLNRALVYSKPGTNASTLPYNESNVLLFTNTDSNIRSSPSTETPVVTRVKEGAMLGWQQSLGDWYSITIMETNQVGYIYRPLVTSEPYRTIVTENECNFRAGPGLNYLQIDRLPKGTSVKLLSVHYVEGFDWYLVERPDTRLAWVRSDQTNIPSGEVAERLTGKVNFGYYFVTINANVSRTAGEYGGFEATLLPGQHVKIISSKTANWYEVEYERNKRGFIQAQNVTSIRNKPLIVAETVNFRENSSEKSAIIDRVPAGTHVFLTGVEFGWCYVKYRDKFGWIAGEYLVPEKFHSLFISKEKSYFRQSPSQSAATLGEIVKGEEIYFFNSKSDWFQFQEYDSKQSVWISINEVDLASFGYGFAPKGASPRSGPGLQYPQVPKAVRQDVRFPIIKEMLGWYQIMIPGQKETGWVSQNEVTRTSDRPLIALDNGQTVQAPKSNTTLSAIEKGTELMEFIYQDGWHYVAVPGAYGWNAIGWIESSKVAPTRYGQTTVSQSTTAYYGPGTQYARNTDLKLSRGASVQIIDIIEGWYQIESFSKVGWIQGR